MLSINKFIIKITFVSWLCLGTTFSVLAQQEAVISQYMFNGLVLNPAYAGAHVQFSATATHRDQWVNFPGAPQTQTFSMHSGFLKSRVGIGMKVSKDKIGVHDDLGLYFSYAYKIKFQQGTLSMGLQAGFNDLKSDYTKLNLRSGLDNVFGVFRKLNPNFGTGLYFRGQTFFAGISAPYLLTNNIVDEEGIVSNAKEARSYYLNAGKTFQVNKDLKVKPSFLLHFQEGAPLSFSWNTNFVIKDAVSLGLSYRSGDALILLFELALNENFHLGYAYDYTLSDINQYSKGSHELMINYRIRINKIHKGIECPSYF